MKNLIILLLFPFFSHAQSWTWATHNDSLFAKYGSVDSFYYTGAPIKGTFWQFIRGNVSDNSALTSALSSKANSTDLSGYSTTSHTHAFSSITSPPTTLSGYGIINGVASTITVNGHALSGNVSVTASDLSLGNVTNTSDANKPVSTAQQTALNLKVNISDTGTAFSPYLRVNVAAATYQAIGSYLIANQTITFTPTGDVTGSSSSGTSLTPALVIGANKVTNAMLSGSIAASKLVGTDIATLGLNTSYNGVTSVSNGLSQIVAQINATAQAANIATATLYTVPASAGFYRISIYITVSQAATTSSTMPSTTITYTDGNSGTNTHSTTTTATSAGNSVTTTFAQTTYILYAKASTNIQYATGSYASSGGTAMNYALRIRVEAL